MKSLDGHFHCFEIDIDSRKKKRRNHLTSPISFIVVEAAQDSNLKRSKTAAHPLGNAAIFYVFYLPNSHRNGYKDKTELLADISLKAVTGTIATLYPAKK